MRLCEWITNEAKKRRSTATPRNGCRTPGFQPPFLLEARGNKCTLPRSVPGAASHGHFRSEPWGPAQPVKQAHKVPDQIISPSSLFSILQGVYTDPNNPDRCRRITHRPPSASVADQPSVSSRPDACWRSGCLTPGDTDSPLMEMRSWPSFSRIATLLVAVEEKMPLQ